MNNTWTDITFCGLFSFTLHLMFLSWGELMKIGDWAGNSYATSGCPGTCAERLTDPTNFVVCYTLWRSFELDWNTQMAERDMEHQFVANISQTAPSGECFCYCICQHRAIIRPPFAHGNYFTNSHSAGRSGLYALMEWEASWITPLHAF